MVCMHLPPPARLLQNKIELVNTLGSVELSSARESDGKKKGQKQL